jgi:hypothetical protein
MTLSAWQCTRARTSWECARARALFHRLARHALHAMALILALPAWSDDGRLTPARTLPGYAQECSACHIAYPPGLLPSTSWTSIMATLDRHFGSDASLEADGVLPIARWLETHAGTYRRVQGRPPEDRITRSAWFERKHRKVDASIWSLPSVRSPAQCQACHIGAEAGRFDDDELQVPQGSPAVQGRAWSR